jgi:hypothetical protein
MEQLEDVRYTVHIHNIYKISTYILNTVYAIG